MSQGSIEVAGLFGNFVPGFFVFRIANLPHNVYAVGYHDEDYAHILGKTQQQVAEVIALDDGVFLV